MNLKRNINTDLIFSLVLLWAILPAVFYSQSIVLGPPLGYSGSSSSPKIKIFFNSSESVNLQWGTNLPAGYKFRIGSSTGNYNRGSVPVSGTSASFSPSSVNLSSGRYYGVITNSSQDNLSGIQSDYLANPKSINYSNQIEFIVESPNAPSPSEPKGSITTATPYFKWNSIPGVKAYWLIVSSTKFSVVTQDNGEVTVQGANILWNYLTTGTSVLYGSDNSNSPMPSSAPPLTSNNTYYYTILNVYDDNDVTYTSSVFGGVESFTYKSETVSLPPQLVAPANKSTFYGANTIQFQWSPVANANSYGVFLLQRVSSFAGNDQQIDIPVWSTTTTNTSVDFPAKSVLTKGKYIWYVVPKDNTGSGSKSDNYEFDYIVKLGKFSASVKSASDGSGIMGFELYPTAISGGSTPANPFISSNSASYTDSLVVGSYLFKAKKSGYYDSTIVVNITSDKMSYFSIYLRPYPAKVSGKVVDQSGAPVNSALVRFTNLLNGDVKNINSTVDGSFSSAIPKGTYSVQVSKAGYLATTPINVTVESDQLIIPGSFVIKLDNASVSGKVLNDESQPVQLATVTANQGNISQQTITDNSGNYSLNLSSGHWIVAVSKEGFISPSASSYDLKSGDNLQNQNIAITPRANQVTGYVYKVSNEGGHVGTSPFGDITVKATPQSGSVVTAVTNASGQYTLSLKSGSWTISASSSGYSSTDPVQMNLTVAQTVSGISFTLKPNPSTISGVAALSDGTALSGVAITSSAGASTVTLSNGSYQMSVPAVSQTITAEKKGYVTSGPAELSVAAGQNLTGINFQFISNAGTISGTVLSQNEPVTGAAIKAVSASGTSELISDQSGEYSFNLQPGTWTITASKQGFLNSSAKTITIGSGQQSINNDLNLLPNSAKIEGTVTGSSQPIGGAQVIISDLNSGSSITTYSNPGGSYSASVDAGKSYLVKAVKEGYSASSQSTQTLTAGSSLSLSFNLSISPASISGKVLDNLQKPLPNVKICFYNSANNSLLDSVQSTDNGNYYIGLHSGNMRIIARKDGYISDSTAISLSAGQNLTDINFGLNENFAVLSGTVKDQSGIAIDGVKINLQSSKGGVTAQSNSDGSFIIRNIIGSSYNVTFSKSGYVDNVTNGYQILDGQTRSLNISMEQLLGKISGTVTTAYGAPIPNASVFAKNSANQTFSTETGSNGSFTISSLAAGDYAVTAAKSGYTSTYSQKVTITKAAPSVSALINDLMQNTGKLSGSVTDQSGLPVANAAVSLSSSFGSISTLSNSAGQYSFESLASCEYKIIASAKGYTFTPSSVNVAGAASYNVVMKKNQSKISGTVRNQKGEVLPYLISVQAVSSLGNLYTVNTDASGKYSFDGVEDNAVFHVATSLFKPGFANDTAAVNVASGVLSVQKDLVITENNAAISGNAGTPGAAISITENSSRKVYIVNSSADGKYSLGYLPAGTYTVKPEKAGFAFTPASQNVSPSYRDSVAANFSAASNTGILKIVAKDNSGKALEQASASLVSSDTLVVRSAVTNSIGEAIFNDVPAGKSYIITVAKEGYFCLSGSVTKSLSVNENASVDLSLVKANSGIKGRTVKTVSGSSSAISGANVKLIHSNKQSLTISSSSDGSFSFTNLQPGKNIKLTAIKAGYVSDTVNVADLAQDEIKSSLELKLQQTSVNVTGRVLYNGSGYKGLSMAASSSSSFTSVTDQNGYFTFQDLPVKTGKSDTTYYEVSIAQSGVPQLKQIVSIASSKIGNSVSLDPFIIPSGKITLTITDGQNPVSGVRVDLSQQGGGKTTTNTTSSNGLFESDNMLQKGTYRISVSKDTYLKPDEKSTRIELLSDTVKVAKVIQLPYTHTPLTSVNADQPAVVNVYCKTASPSASGILKYRLKSSDVSTQAAMTKTGDSFQGTIPALNSADDIIYSAEINDTQNSVTYSTGDITITTAAVGVLSGFSMSPEINNSRVRLGDTYHVNLSMRDALQNNLNESFLTVNHKGSVKWEAEDPSSVRIVAFIDDSTKATIIPLKEGNIKLNITARLSSSVIKKSIQFTSAKIDIKEVTIQSPLLENELSNKSGVQLSSSCVDSSSKTILLQNSIGWNVNPAGAGTIYNGYFQPADSTVIGNVEITARDGVSGKSGKISLSVYAALKPGLSYSLTDKNGWSIMLQEGSIPFYSMVYFDKPKFGPAKKYFTPSDGSQTFTVSDKLYNFKVKCETGLPGDSLQRPATISLPLENADKFSKGVKYIGWYNPVSKEWKLFNSNSANGSLSTSSIFHWGEYSILSGNEALGLQYVSVLPSPFSPDVAPLKIGYYLTTQTPPASVSIKIYNLRGELVRTIFDNDLQFPGRYGSRTGNKEVVWDGKTDDGTQARNGRYIIRISAKDFSGEKSELVQCVLIK